MKFDKGYLLLIILTILLSGCEQSDPPPPEDIPPEPEPILFVSEYSGKVKIYAKIAEPYFYVPDYGSLIGQDDVTLTISNKPSWMNFNDKTGELSGIPKYAIKQRKVYFDISVQAQKGEVTINTPPFNIIIRNKNNKLEDNILVVSLKYSDTNTTRSVDINSSLNNIKNYFKILSRNHQSVKFTTIDLGVVDISAADAKNYADTSSFLNLAWEAQEGDNYSYKATCELTDKLIADANKILQKFENKANQGIEIDELSLDYAKNKATHPCRSMAMGDFLISYVDIPSSINIDDFRLIIFDIYDTNRHSGGLQGTLTKAEGVTHNGVPIINKNYIVSGSTQSNIVQSVRFTDILSDYKKAQLEYYTNGQVALTGWEKVTSHELVHFFGIGTHDSGFDYYTDTKLLNNLSDRLVKGDLYAKLDYGDWFSVLGEAKYAIGLAPATLEYLGWITSNQIVKVNDDATVIISEYNTPDANVTAQINLPNNKGRLYISYHAGTQYGESLKKTELVSNTKGLLVRYSSIRTLTHPLTTSLLLDTDNNLQNHNFAIKEGESYSLFGITINDVDISDDKSSASFKVYFP
jgi:hypothetical protein